MKLVQTSLRLLGSQSMHGNRWILVNTWVYAYHPYKDQEFLITRAYGCWNTAKIDQVYPLSVTLVSWNPSTALDNVSSHQLVVFGKCYISRKFEWGSIFIA